MFQQVDIVFVGVTVLPPPPSRPAPISFVCSVFSMAMVSIPIPHFSSSALFFKTLP